ncbi:hypothetical protein G6F57_014796 [Rhizopus arrhizus]|nr:hypothetical protein G6F65_017436 [Rhizopus arrhizus]KAG1457939.1 hypothetical protein G6F57_014796 [Rhizopus arrhizus]
MPHALRPCRPTPVHPHRGIPQPDPGGQTGALVPGRRQRADQSAGKPAEHPTAVPRQPRRGNHARRPEAAAARPRHHAAGGPPEARLPGAIRRRRRSYPHLRQHHGRHRIHAGHPGAVPLGPPGRHGRPARTPDARHRARRAGRHDRPRHRGGPRGRARIADDPLQHRPAGTGGAQRASAAGPGKGQAGGRRALSVHHHARRFHAGCLPA